jgi:hypothetical protein
MSALTKVFDIGELSPLDGNVVFARHDIERLTDQLMDGEKPDDTALVREELAKIKARAAATLQWMDKNDV